MATVTKGKTFINGDLVTPAVLHQLVDSATVTNIANADISSSAAIADTKLATLSTSGKVANSATSATELATENTIVSRNASGNFAAGTIFANLSGNATNVTGTVAVANGGTGATTAPTARTNLGLGNASTLNTGTTANTLATGDHTHTQLHDRKHAISSTSDHTAGAHKIFHSNDSGQIIELALGAPNSVLTSNGTAVAPTFQTLSATTTSANNLTGGTAGAVPFQTAAGATSMTAAGTTGQVLRSNGSSPPAFASFGTSGNTANEVVARDGSGNFSAGTITAALTGIATNVSGTVAVANGGTGATTAANARTNLGIGSSATLNTGTTANTLATGDHTHSAATTSAAGFMSAADKSLIAAATNANTASAIVKRDASGNFSAGTITAALTGSASGSAATLATGRTIALTGEVTATTGAFNGSANVSAAATITASAVTTAKISDSAVTTDKIKDSAVTTEKIANGAVTNIAIATASITNDKLFAGSNQFASAWVAIKNIADIVVSGTTFTKVSNTVVRVTRTAHVLLNGDNVCFNALASPNNYLNGTHVVSGVTSNTFDFTISGATVPAGTLAAQIVRATRIMRKFNVALVGRFGTGNYRVFYETPTSTSDYISLGSASKADGDPLGLVGAITQETGFADIITTTSGGVNTNYDTIRFIIFGGG